VDEAVEYPMETIHEGAARAVCEEERRRRRKRRERWMSMMIVSVRLQTF
jgi:hypothetical protein